MSQDNIEVDDIPIVIEEVVRDIITEVTNSYNEQSVVSLLSQSPGRRSNTGS